MVSSQGATNSQRGKDADRVELILCQIEQLPTLPAVATRVIQATRSSQTSASDVVALIETDQSLTAKILALVRRSDLGARGEVGTVSRAVVVLGFAAVRNAVLSIQVYETFSGLEASEGSALKRSEFWKHSLAVACAAQSIAGDLGPGVSPDEAFVCGLLHDMGKVALDACLPKSYARIVRETEARRACICDVERSVLGLDHTVAGKRLAQHWKLPESIVECVWLHHQSPDGLPASIGATRLVEIVHLADEVVRRQRIGYSGYNRNGDVGALAERLGLKDDALDRVLSELGPQVEEHAELLGLSGLTSGGLYAQALVDANEELGRLNVELVETNRRLQARSRGFDALRRLQEGLSGDDQVLEVCGDVAGAARAFLGTEGPAFCFSLNESGTVYHVGSTLGEREATAVLPTEAAPEGESLLPAGGLMRAPATAQPVIDHFKAHLSSGPVWMWPIRHASRLVGGVLITGQADRIAALSSCAEELAALSGAFGLALATATARAHSEKLVEELADANRRLQAAQDAILRSKSLGMIAATAAGAAHELNNPLSVISGRAQMLASGETDAARQKTLRTVQEQAQRASDIVSDLLAFAKPTPPRPERISVLPWLQGFRGRWLAKSSRDPERFTVAVEDPALTVRVDPDQLEHILENVLANAVEATTPENMGLVVNSASRASDDSVVIAVEDNGRGMPTEVLEHALDPFFSHRQAGRGRGLGLSLAYSLALANGGDLWLESTPGVGTTAFIGLPAGRTT
ncbi:MAG TPA: HDOD domain-containing protein [Phycisphaerae bacterium]|nr:HDOD domain-containing protein [Phycisphaerae bacterium]